MLSLVEAVRKDTAPTYGSRQGRLDQELTLAIRISAMQGGMPVKIPIDPKLQSI